MNPIKESPEFWTQLLDMLQNQFGEKSEIVLHDLTGDYNHSIVDIRNGYITGRKIGDSGTNLGLEVLRGTVKDGDRYNYVSNNMDGKILRSSSMYLKDENGKVVGSLCINTDITDTVVFENYLRRYNRYSSALADNNVTNLTDIPYVSDGEPVEKVEEVFASDVTQLLDSLMDAAQKHIGIDVEDMKRSDKVEYIRYLDSKGAFLITKSAEKVYEYLQISKYTFYKYLDSIHEE